MPLFGFQCNECESEHELLLRADESPACPDCGSPRLVKLASRFAAVTAADPKPSPAMTRCGSPHCCRMPGVGCDMN
jgi:putative FmdB family regulatory protein